MKIIYKVPWKDVELENFRNIIRRNVYTGLRATLAKAEELEKSVDVGKDVLEAFSASVKPQNVVFDAQFATNAKALWANETIKTLWEAHKDAIFLGPMDWFFDKVDDVCKDDWNPTEDDILRCRQRTLGASTNLIYAEKAFWEFIDVGGQQPEREKWEKVMENNVLHGIIFFVAADEYDTVDSSVGSPITKINLAKMIWRDLFKKCAIDMQSTSLMLFFNKVDIFAEYVSDKTRFAAFQKRYPAYKGKNGTDESLQFLKEEFMEGLDTKVTVKTHFNCALDTDAMKMVWNNVREHIIKSRLQASGLLYSEDFT